MKQRLHYLRMLFVLVIAGAIASCHGGSSGNLLPSLGGPRHAQAIGAAPAVAQWASGTPWAPASITVSWSAAPAAGDVLVVAFWNNGQSTGAANTYAAPAGWTLADQNVSHAYATYQAFTHVVGAGENNSYVFTPAAAQRQHAWIGADVSNASGIDTGGNQFVNMNTAYTTPTLTPSQAGDLAVTFNLPMTTSSLTWTVPGTWTLGTGPTSTWRGEALYQALSSTASVSESSTLSAAATGFSAMLLLAPTGVVSTPSPTPAPTASPAPTPSSGGGAAPAPAQWTSGAAYAPSSVNISFKSAPAAGDVLVVALWNNGQSTGAANTYTAPARWTLADQNTASYATYQQYWHVVSAGEANTYSFTPAAAQREQAWIAADVGNASGVDKSADFLVNSTAYTTPSVTPSQTGDLAIAFNLPMTLGSVTWTNPSPWTLGTGPSPTWSGEAVYEGLSSTTSLSESSTLSSSVRGFSAIVLLSPSGSSPQPTPSASPATAVDWSTFGYDLQRTGYNPNETTIGTGSFGTLHPMWTTLPSVGFYMQGEPVVATGVSVGGTNRNLMYAGAQSGVLYALDADSGSVVWSKQLGTSSFTCGSSSSTPWGIGGTATLDRPRNRVYVSDGQNQVHALDLATGAEASGWPVTIAQVTGHDFMHIGLTYNPSNGFLYAETSTTCDITPWYGRISAINTATAAITNTFYPTQGASGGGIWGFGGAAVDPSTNYVFIAVGNADGTNQAAYYGEHIVELSADLSSVLAQNYPTTLPAMADEDFGTTPILFQPIGCPPLLAATNKSGAFVLYNRSNISAGPTQTIVMSVTNDSASFRQVPAYDPVTNYLYVDLTSTYGIYQPGLGAFSITSNCTLNPTPVWNAVFGPDGATTPNQTTRSAITIANGVVYVSGYTDNTTYAFNAATGTKLWSASLSGSGIVGPVVVNGHLYVGDLSGTIRAWKP